jgi:hypothetical protein
VEDGGTLVRFAGPRMAATASDDPLLPVELRLGERTLGGSLSWTEPQPVAPFPDTGPFGGLDAPREVAVNRQVLAQPDLELASHKTWANLADGTPLVTGDGRGKGHRPVPRHRRGDMVEPADLGLLRRDAAPHRQPVAQHRRAAAGQFHRRRRSAAALTHPRRRRRTDRAAAHVRPLDARRLADAGQLRSIPPASTAPRTGSSPAMC